MSDSDGTPEASKPSSLLQDKQIMPHAPVNGKWEKETFFVEEYKALTLHYSHEDVYYLQTVGLFATFNVGLLTLYGSNIIVATKSGVHTAFILLGIFSSIAFSFSLTRIRYLRRRIEDRIREMEVSINEHWISRAAPPEVNLLKLRNRDESARWFERLPVSKIMLTFPSVFLAIWSTLALLMIFKDI